jgi:hypothetical protein
MNALVHKEDNFIDPVKPIPTIHLSQSPHCDGLALIKLDYFHLVMEWTYICIQAY